MPIVFVHGVNNRVGPDYDQRLEQRKAFLRTIVVPALGLDKANVKFFDPYWGSEGVKFRWQNATVPELGKEYEPLGGNYESFGGDYDESELTLMNQIPELARYLQGDIVSIARQSLPDAVELLWTAAMANAKSLEVHAALAETYLLVADYAEREKSPSWLEQVVTDNFVYILIDKARTSISETGYAVRGQDVYESFGLSEFLEELGEAASRIGNVLGDLSGDFVSFVGRRKAHIEASIFIGDVLQYMNSRGKCSHPGVIPQVVIKAIRKAQDARTVDDPELIVVGHSLGGVISYDVLTHFAPDLEVDVFVSVGSQVGLFEEMTLYKESQIGVPPNPPNDRLKRPMNIKRWLNVFDSSDIFSFRAEPVFEGVNDFFYDTGYGLVGAHGGYFERPSFYRFLAENLTRADV